MRFAIVVVAILVPFSTANSATSSEIEKRHTKAYNNCLNSGDAAQGVQPAMNACAADEYIRQDGRLNQAYVMVMKRLKPARKNNLRMSQRKWIKQRDITCKAEMAEYEGGSIAPLIFHSCMTNETIERTMWLEKYR
jgi:uncharacterized protein YecT (DUF1311 family)